MKKNQVKEGTRNKSDRRLITGNESRAEILNRLEQCRHKQRILCIVREETLVKKQFDTEVRMLRKRSAIRYSQAHSFTFNLQLPVVNSIGKSDPILPLIVVDDACPPVDVSVPIDKITTTDDTTANENNEVSKDFTPRSNLSTSRKFLLRSSSASLTKATTPNSPRPRSCTVLPAISNNNDPRGVWSGEFYGKDKDRVVSHGESRKAVSARALLVNRRDCVKEEYQVASTMRPCQSGTFMSCDSDINDRVKQFLDSLSQINQPEVTKVSDLTETKEIAVT